MSVELTISHNPKEETTTATQAEVAQEIQGADMYRIKVRGALFTLDDNSANATIIMNLRSLRRVESFHTVGNKHVVTVHPWRA